MISSTNSKCSIFDVLTPYDLAVRVGRGLATTALAGICVKVCLNSLLTLPSELPKCDACAVTAVATTLLTAVAAYKCVTRVIKEIKAPLYEKEIPQFLEDHSKNEAVLFLQAKRDWSGDVTCQTRSTMKILKELSSRYAVFKERVGSVQEINQAIDKLYKTGKKIKMVALVGHGSRSEIELGSSDLNSDTVDQINFKAIKGSTLVLFSCYGGIFAKTIQQAAGSTIEIQGSSAMLGPRCVKIEDLKTLKFSFGSPFSSRDTTIRIHDENAHDDSLCARLTDQLFVFAKRLSRVVIIMGIGTSIGTLINSR